MTWTWQRNAAFVIQLRTGTDLAAGSFEGKVTHIASIRSVRFHSLDELLEFIAVVLSETDDASPREPGQ